jgi:hypothetical protein
VFSTRMDLGDPERTGAVDTDTVQKLVEQAKKDPKFLHALVFDPESVMPRLDYLDRGAKSALLGSSPESVITALIGQRSGGGSGGSSQDNAP